MQDAARTTTVTVAGASMGPTLPPGTRVLVARAEAPFLAPGDIVLLAADPRPILHRVLHVARRGDHLVVFHRGDAGGGIGVADGSVVLGSVVAVLQPTPGPAPALAMLPAVLRRSFTRAQRRARLAALLMTLGLRRRALPRWVRRAAEWLLR